ncbi:MAG: hypothetical protein ABI613_02015 [Gemmatimonadota bacterium]
MPRALTSRAALDSSPAPGARTSVVAKIVSGRRFWKWIRRSALLIGLGTAILFLPLRPAIHAPRVAVASGATSVTLAAGPQYGAGPVRRWLLGGRYRVLWQEPITVPVLDMEHFDGGLRVIREGGGMQSRTLHLRSTKGRHFLFRSVDKDLLRLIDPRLGRSLAAAVLQDQASASHPAGVLVAAPLQAAVGLIQSNPTFVVLPDAASLGTYGAQFSGMFGTIQEDPDDLVPPLPRGQAARVLHTEEMLPLIDASPGQRVDARQFLTARLLDLFLNDWDRHEGQWRWSEVVTAGDTTWNPIPVDRDQAFAWYDGLLVRAARIGLPKLISFGPRYASLNGLTWNARRLDPRLLGGLSRPTWDSIASWITAQLSDSTIQAAARRMPEPYWRIEGKSLVTTLQQRRRGLREIADRFYLQLAREPEAHGTSSDEEIMVDGSTDGALVVRIAPRDHSGIQQYARRLDPRETHAVQIFPGGGRDTIMTSGNLSTIDVIVIDSEGRRFPLKDYQQRLSQ